MDAPKEFHGFKKHLENDTLSAVWNYIESGSEKEWKLLYRVNFPEYGSPLEPLANAIPCKQVSPGEDRMWDRLFRVSATFLGPACELRSAERDRPIRMISELEHSMPASLYEQAKTV